MVYTSIPLLESIKINILNPVITLLFAAALLYFLWGVFQLFSGEDSDEARIVGRRHMIWGVTGLFIMVAVYGILQIICNTIGCN
ncbi:MAG: hypothetical protein HYV76_02570 [Candidatus Vogelbacteria bacterium]|nr:hypothetical protein [Candidatus Vogelbacteria bacterium]